MLQDLFSSGAIKSATDFQVYQEVAGLSGLDFAYSDNSAVYHTKVFHLFLFSFFVPIHLKPFLTAFHYSTESFILGWSKDQKLQEQLIKIVMYDEAYFCNQLLT